MSDEALRELERRFRASGAADDERRWLVERVRLGRVRPERLEVAGWVGHPAARLVLGEAARPVPADLVEWLLGLAAWDDVDVPLRAALAACRFALARADRDAAATAPLFAHVDAAAAWFESPDQEHLKQVSATFRTLTPALLLRAGVAGAVPMQAGLAIRTCLEDLPRFTGRRRRHPGLASLAARGLANGAAQIARVIEEPGLRAAVRDEVARWALA